MTGTDWTTPLLAALHAAAADPDYGHQRFGDIIDELSAKLTARLAHEEADGLPLIDACLAPAQWQHFAQVHGERNLPDAPRYMPWLLAEASRQTLDADLGKFPAPMRDYDRAASLFTPDGALRMPNIPAELAGREEIRAGGERLQSQWEFFVQTTHPGTIQLDGDTATGRAYIQELARTRDGRQGLNYAIYHDRYQRTSEGWKFTERVYEVRYLDTTPLAGSAPPAAATPADPLAGETVSAEGG